MKQNFKLLIAVFLTIILMPLKVDALEQAVISVDKTELEAGDFVNVVVDLDYNKDLYAFTASLSFDENVFEVLDTKNFEAQDEWSDIVYNKENNKFALINKSGENKEHLMMIKLFVKDNPVAGETRITLNNLVGSNGSRDIYFTDVNKTLNIKGDKNVRPSYVKKEEIKQKDYATKTFKPFIIIGFVLFVVFIGIMILINTQFLKNVLFTKKDYKKPLTMVFGGLAAFTLIMIIILAVMHGNRGDVNDDGNSNYEDARDINEYLIDITKESDDNKDEVIINKGPTYNTTSYSKSTNKHKKI